VGHNPAGALAIVGLLAAAMLIVASGWATYNDVGGGWLEELHEGAANGMMTLVVIHIAGVIVSSWLHHQNLVLAMITGWKTRRS
jgi:cytochrome b